MQCTHIKTPKSLEPHKTPNLVGVRLTNQNFPEIMAGINLEIPSCVIMITITGCGPG